MGRPTGNRCIPSLEQYIESHPEFFVRAIAWTYKRADGDPDPEELQVPPDRRSDMAGRGYKLLNALKRIPGRDDLGELKVDRLAHWVASVRQSCALLGRAEVADLSLGTLLARAPVGKDGVWPCEPVRQVMEEIQSERMMDGAHTGVYNSRGVHAKGEGGAEERELADLV